VGAGASTTPSPSNEPVADAGGNSAVSPALDAPLAEILALERVHEAPVHSLALGKPGRFAALGADAWLDEGQGAKQLPRPNTATENVEIYFGRDDKPRLMGFVRGASGDESVYLRWRGGAWQRGAVEIGKLGAGPRAALFGVLGYDDPEVVCKVGEQCIIKRLSGWKMIAPPAGLPRVVLCGPRAWAFENDRVLRLEDAGFVRFAAPAPFKRATSLWATSDSELWVAEEASNFVHRFDGKSWTSTASPVSKPLGLWATSASDVWLVGASGAAHYDGKAWARVRGAPQSLRVVTGRGPGEVWLAGDSGIWRGKR
jgi:hypothetical protein